MTRINVNDKYDVLQNSRRVRLVDRQNGAVVVDFIAPQDIPGKIGDAMKQAFDLMTGRTQEQKTESTKKKTSSKKTKKEIAELVEEAVADDGDET